MNTIADNELLAAALVGYESQLRTINEKIHEIQSEIGGSGKAAVVSDGATSKRHMSASAKARIAGAQRQRWAAYHKEQGTKAPAKKVTGKKRKLSAAGRKAIAEATKKRWAAYRAEKAAVSA